jgi:hypothetical protein
LPPACFRRPAGLACGPWFPRACRRSDPGCDATFERKPPSAQISATDIGATFDKDQDPTWDGESHSWRLNLEQPTLIGLINLGGHYSKEQRNREQFANPDDTKHTELDTTWWPNAQGRVEFKPDRAGSWASFPPPSW